MASTAKSPAKRSSTPKKQPPAIVPDDALLAKAAKIAAQLQQLYPSPAIPLEHSTPFQLLCAVMMSAQTTDKKVCGCRATVPAHTLHPTHTALGTKTYTHGPAAGERSHTRAVHPGPGRCSNGSP
jgi:hypothetical protein